MSFSYINRETIAWMIIGLSGAVFIATLGCVIHAWSFVHNAYCADGVVTKMLEEQGERDLLMYSPVITFHDKQNMEHAFHSSTRCSVPQYKVGEAVRILYRSNDPNDAEIDSLFSIWGGALITGMLGSFWISVGFILLRWPRIMSLLSAMQSRPDVK